MGRPTKTIELSEGERAELEKLVRGHSTRQSLARRARVVLMWAEGCTVARTEKKLRLSSGSTYLWRRRFAADRLQGLADQPGRGRPRELSERKAKEILILTVSRVPHEATHWSLRLMAKAAGVSTWHVRQVWAGADLRPHRLKTFKLSDDPDFAEKVCDVVGLYMNPPENAMVLSVDEKTEIQALDRTQPMLQLRPGQIERRTHDYKRNGTTNLYAAFDIATGQVIGRTAKRHRSQDFLGFLRQVEQSIPSELTVHLILDNSSTHKTGAVMAWFANNPRFRVHFTPTSASWLNAVESWFSQLERRALERGVFTSVQSLRAEIHRYITAHNQRSAKPFVWTKPAAEILASVARARESSGY